jgi:hypothetical protein
VIVVDHLARRQTRAPGKEHRHPHRISPFGASHGRLALPLEKQNIGWRYAARSAIRNGAAMFRFPGSLIFAAARFRR